MKEKKDVLQTHKRTVLLYEEITQNTAVDIGKQIALHNISSEKDRIDLLINSSGGNPDAALMIYDAIRLSRAPVYATVKGMCGSIAILALVACKPDRRSASEFSRFLIHPITRSPVIVITENSKLLALQKELRESFSIRKKKQKKINQLICKSTKLTLRDCKNLSEKFFLAQRAHKYGLVAKVI